MFTIMYTSIEWKEKMEKSKQFTNKYSQTRKFQTDLYHIIQRRLKKQTKY